ncbi:MAG TPA: sodium/proton antiporter NhaB [Xanthomonadales bacterium]|nr:sodium/proton antiporter NhaB [Xanthomonadales bacterium]
MISVAATSLGQSFLGHTPHWFKSTLVLFLLLNPLALVLLGPMLTGWLFVIEFIFCLVMALHCYPLQSGGLLAIEAVMLGLASPEAVFHETAANMQVIFLLIFMVAGIFFLKELLMFIFTRILVRIRSKRLLSLMFCFTAAFLSAFLDALTVTAVIITVANGFYAVYHRVSSGIGTEGHHDHSDDNGVALEHREDLESFRAFLRNLLMHGAVGTALGGVTTLVGEPQNLLIGHLAQWDFAEFFLRLAPVSLPVLAVGLLTCFLIERQRWFGYGAEMPVMVRRILEEYESDQSARRSEQQKGRIAMQALIAFFLILALAFHWAEVGMVGLAVIVLATAFNGVIQEHRIGAAFAEALPFTALLVVFFTIVAVIHEQKLIHPVVEYVFTLDGGIQVPVFYLANGFLSAITDNVFVATVYMNEVTQAFNAGAISKEQFHLLAIAINAGTNIPSVATPNGQAAFLFLLTSAVAPLIRLGYGRMVLLALPYTITISLTGLLAMMFLL